MKSAELIEYLQSIVREGEEYRVEAISTNFIPFRDIIIRVDKIIYSPKGLSHDTKNHRQNKQC